MKIALTGSSSSGKTTLARSLMENPKFVELAGEFVTEDARSLLRTLGHQSMDEMTRAEQREFQERYLEQKAANELDRECFLVDRSYVDVAAYWLVRDGFDLPLDEQERFEHTCCELARNYDIHIHFPFGQISFASDGYRSEDVEFHERIATKIHDLLRGWDIEHVTIESPNLEARLKQVLVATGCV